MDIDEIYQELLEGFGEFRQGAEAAAEKARAAKAVGNIVRPILWPSEWKEDKAAHHCSYKGLESAGRVLREDFGVEALLMTNYYLEFIKSRGCTMTASFFRRAAFEVLDKEDGLLGLAFLGKVAESLVDRKRYVIGGYNSDPHYPDAVHMLILSPRIMEEGDAEALFLLTTYAEKLGESGWMYSEPYTEKAPHLFFGDVGRHGLDAAKRNIVVTGENCIDYVRKSKPEVVNSVRHLRRLQVRFEKYMDSLFEK